MPHALRIATDGRVTGADRSRPQPIEAPWVQVSAAQFAAAQSLAYPRWTGADVVSDPPAPPTLEALKASRIAENRTECSRRILAAWPEAQQRNAALGILSAEQTDACAAWIKAHRAAENAAADLIDAATDAAGIAAVEVVWP